MSVLLLKLEVHKRFACVQSTSALLSMKATRCAMFGCNWNQLYETNFVLPWTVEIVSVKCSGSYVLCLDVVSVTDYIIVCRDSHSPSMHCYMYVPHAPCGDPRHSPHYPTAKRDARPHPPHENCVRIQYEHCPQYCRDILCHQALDQQTFLCELSRVTLVSDIQVCHFVQDGMFVRVLVVSWGQSIWKFSQWVWSVYNQNYFIHSTSKKMLSLHQSWNSC